MYLHNSGPNLPDFRLANLVRCIRESGGITYLEHRVDGDVRVFEAIMDPMGVLPKVRLVSVVPDMSDAAFEVLH